MTAVIQKPISQLKITLPLLPDDFILPDDPVDDTDRPLLAPGLRQRADRQQQAKELAQTLLSQERQRNQELLARLAALGIDPE